VNIAIVTLLTLGLVLSLIRARQQPSPHVPG
jgi:hypothetical protein